MNDEDRLARRQKIVQDYGTTPYQLAERIMALEDEISRLGGTIEDFKLGQKHEMKCAFPEHRHPAYGHVTHMKYLGTMEGYMLESCEVCGAVRAYPPAVLG